MFWYRGYGDAAWPLEPSLLRQPYATLAREYDAKFQQVFLARGSTLFGRDWPECAVRRYALMQHHGFPTRLLDWSESSLIALYFAVRGQCDSDSAVWVLDSDALSGIGPFQNRPFPPFGAVYEMDALRDLVDWRVGNIGTEAIAEDFIPIPLVPSHFGLRDTVQRGRFTLHAYSQGALDGLSRELAFGSARIRTLVKLRVPNEFRARIRDELLHFGITETSVYPDLEGLARELRFLASGGTDVHFADESRRGCCC